MKPYTYLIRWTKLDISYYGVRYAQDCDPSDLWNPYKTSSIHVAKFIAEHGEPDVAQVRKTFIDVPVAQDWEHRVLKRTKAVSSDKWLNRTDNKSIAPQYGEDHPHYGKKGEAHHCYGKPNKGASEAQKRRWANPDNKNPMGDPAIVAKKVAKTSGDNHHMKRPEVAEKVSGKNNWIFQKTGALEERSKRFIEMNKARKGTQYRRVDCTYCGKDYSSVQIKQHEKRCEINLARLVVNTDQDVYNNLASNLI
jgi:hypothetical protein